MPAQLSQTSHSSSNIGWTDSGWYIQSPSKKSSGARDPRFGLIWAGWVIEVYEF